MMIFKGFFGDTDYTFVSQNNQQFKISLKSQKDEIVEKSGKNLKNENVVRLNISINNDISKDMSNYSRSKKQY